MVFLLSDVFTVLLHRTTVTVGKEVDALSVVARVEGSRDIDCTKSASSFLPECEW